MHSISLQARARRRRRKLLLGTTLATGAVLWGARQATSTGDDTDAEDAIPDDIDAGDDLAQPGEATHDETMHGVWPG